MNWGLHGTAKIIWLAAWLILPLYVIFLVAAHRGRRRFARRFGELPLLFGTLPDDVWKTPVDAIKARSGDPVCRMRIIRQSLRYRENVKSALVVLAMAALLAALGRPQWGTRQEMIHHSGIDCVICVDTSYSMTAQDVAPDRITLAASIIRSLLSELDGNRIGLVSFATTTRVHSPLTLDYRVIQSILEYSLNMGPGTDMEAAIDTGLNVLKNSNATTRALVIVSDGENHGGNIDKAIQNARSAGVIIYTLGTGTPEGGPIPEDSADRGGYMRHEGELVWTRLDETVLRRMAEATGGRYYRVTPAHTEASHLAYEIRNLEKTEFSQAIRTHREEQFGLFLLLAVFLLGLEAIIHRLGLVRWEEGDETV